MVWPMGLLAKYQPESLIIRLLSKIDGQRFGRNIFSVPSTGMVLRCRNWFGSSGVATEPLMAYGPARSSSRTASGIMTAETPRSLALDELHRRLTTGHYHEGRLPPERELASQLGVGRRALREALAALEQEGLIWRRQGHGTFISTHPMIDEPEIARLANNVNPVEIVEARLMIEPMLVRHSAMRISRAEIDKIRRLADSAHVAKDARTYETFDIAFHRKIAESAGNALFLAMFEMIISVREKANWRRVREYYFEHDGAERSYREHTLIIDAIAQRDPPAAEAMMRQHLRNVAQVVLGVHGLLGGPPDTSVASPSDAPM